MTGRRRQDDIVRAIDLFCGAGGLSWGLAQACERLDHEVQLAAVNHWDRAIETHEQNHLWADHYHAKVEELDPRNVFDTERVDILTGGPQCTHFSTARGGRPVDEQKRASPWHVLNWLQKLYVDNFVIENVSEFRSWGPIGADGQPLQSQKGETFDAWINALHSLGYNVDWKILNAADYGDATSRKRLFIIGRRQYRPEWPEPTHSENGQQSETEPWRSAAEIINWGAPGESIWTRNRPLVQNTMQRIAEGIRRHGHDELAVYADVVGDLTKADVATMQENAVTIDEDGSLPADRDEPFLVQTAVPTETDQLMCDGGESNESRTGLCLPYLLGQQSGSRPRSVAERPVPTIATRGAISLIDPYLVPFYSERNGQAPRTHDIDAPAPTITATGSQPAVTRPYLIQYNGQSGAQDIEEPLPTITTRDSFALCLPEHYPWGLDIRFRMLQPRELAAAMGFPDDYEFVGNKTETIEQIGNAVPVNLAQALCERLLAGRDPTLLTYTDSTHSQSTEPATQEATDD